jgi:cation diffusion facilitator family transporter
MSTGGAAAGGRAATRSTAGKTGAARLSVVSNSLLIVLKIVAGAITGSIAILTEAIHSAVDLLASVVAFVSVRKADEPADESHLYGHAKIENLAAAIEGMLILVGAGVIVFEAARRLQHPRPLESLGIGIAVIATSMCVNVLVSAYLFKRARRHSSPALEGDAEHLRADALTSSAVLAGLVVVELTGWDRVDPIVALIVAAAIVYAGLRILGRSSRVLVDEALPAQELEVVRSLVRTHPARELAGFHKLRGRRAGSQRHIDIHLQFRPGTSLERAHTIAHDLQRLVAERLPGAEMLIHIEPER